MEHQQSKPYMAMPRWNQFQGIFSSGRWVSSTENYQYSHSLYQENLYLIS